jgi:hypothetical protein
MSLTSNRLISADRNKLSGMLGQKNERLQLNRRFTIGGQQERR